MAFIEQNITQFAGLTGGSGASGFFAGLGGASGTAPVSAASGDIAVDFAAAIEALDSVGTPSDASLANAAQPNAPQTELGQSGRGVTIAIDFVSDQSTLLTEANNAALSQAANPAQADQTLASVGNNPLPSVTGTDTAGVQAVADTPETSSSDPAAASDPTIDESAITDLFFGPLSAPFDPLINVIDAPSLPPFNGYSPTDPVLPTVATVETASLIITDPANLTSLTPLGASGEGSVVSDANSSDVAARLGVDTSSGTPGSINPAVQGAEDGAIIAASATSTSGNADGGLALNTVAVNNGTPAETVPSSIPPAETTAATETSLSAASVDAAADQPSLQNPEAAQGLERANRNATGDVAGRLPDSADPRAQEALDAVATDAAERAAEQRTRQNNAGDLPPQAASQAASQVASQAVDASGERPLTDSNQRVTTQNNSIDGQTLTAQNQNRSTGNEQSFGNGHSPNQFNSNTAGSAGQANPNTQLSSEKGANFSALAANAQSTTAADAPTSAQPIPPSTPLVTPPPLTPEALQTNGFAGGLLTNSFGSLLGGGDSALGAPGLFAGRPSEALVGQVRNQFNIAISRAAIDGQQEFNVRLNPIELGRINVKLQFIDDGFVRANIAVENPETLELLQRDARGLERALEASGHKTEVGGISFGLEKGDQESAGKALAEALQQEEFRDELAARGTPSGGGDDGTYDDAQTDIEDIPLDDILPYVSAETGLDIRI